MDLELDYENSLDYNFDLENGNLGLDLDSEVSDSFELLSTLAISIGFSSKLHNKEENKMIAVEF